MDEASLTGTTTVCEVNAGRMNSFFLVPEQLGFTRCALSDLVGGDAQENARIALDILGGKKGPKRDIVVLNSALCLYMFGSSVTLRDCVHRAEELIDSGKAMARLESFKRLTNEAAS